MFKLQTRLRGDITEDLSYLERNGNIKEGDDLCFVFLEGRAKYGKFRLNIRTKCVSSSNQITSAVISNPLIINWLALLFLHCGIESVLAILKKMSNLCVCVSL